MTTKADLLAAIRAKCLDCCCYRPGEVRICGGKSCHLHDFRMGKDPNPARRAPGRPFGKNAPPGTVILARTGEAASVECTKPAPALPKFRRTK